ncbi:phosphatidylinositol N-acetylglucosaminyltransferase subunit Q [Ostrinia furnacalis]|uniref:phosphatidylinositol N-acetylglucosaminyltransferase subunit Q n=1 Tax=Ostrinia furnacalis TaxID=93504 RepID=UPI00103A8CC8|nr:phosphatidylinositol N-acetylglucosaminyltransferase subunit Q [Ostrinia furnacalis]
MLSSVQILLPSISNTSDVIYYKGYVNFKSDTKVTIYFIKFSENSKTLLEDSDKDMKNIIYGCYSEDGIHSSTFNKSRNYNKLIISNQSGELYIKKLFINGNAIDAKDKCLIVFYDLNTIRESEVEWEYSDELSKLQQLVLSENRQPESQPYDATKLSCPIWFSSSMFIQHVINYFNVMKWLLITIKRDKKVSIKHGNLICAILMDLILGYVILQYLTQDTKELSSILMGILEKLINILYSLLKWLMGAPAGLKLNNAFTKMLGKCFSYHVQLWWLFLDVSGEKLDIILHLFYYLGYLGLTFQAAMISDMICIGTFHAYCIYVYAARMFNMQISGLIALLRFFVGRKYNPLRKGIDSCEYTNQELFVGTVAFTIMLLLLPTTLMYYIVFTMFRVLSLLVEYVLAKFIYQIQTLPLYVSALWLIRSPKVAGNVLLEVVSQEEASPFSIELKLLNKSLMYLVNNFKPPVDEPKKVVWTSFLSKVFIGEQIL